MVFPVVMYVCESWTIKKAGAEELMLLNCGVGENSRAPSQKKSVTVSIVSPSISHEVMGPDAMILSFLNVEL